MPTKKPKPRASLGKITTNSKTKEEQAAISRENGSKSVETLAGSAYEKSEEMPVDYSVSDMLADIYDPRARIAPELKIHAAACFMMTGTVNGAAKLCGIDHRTLSDWKNNAQWWPTVLQKVRKEKQDELDAELTALIHTSTDALADRLANGEEVLVKDGPDTIKMKKALNARDIINSISTLYDKRAMLRGDPTSITQKTSSTDVLNDLRAEFSGIADRALNKKIIKDVPSNREE